MAAGARSLVLWAVPVSAQRAASLREGEVLLLEIH